MLTKSKYIGVVIGLKDTELRMFYPGGGGGELAYKINEGDLGNFERNPYIVKGTSKPFCRCDSHYLLTLRGTKPILS